MVFIFRFRLTVWKAKNSDVCGGNYGYNQQILLEAGQEAFLEHKKPGKS